MRVTPLGTAGAVICGRLVGMAASAGSPARSLWHADSGSGGLAAGSTSATYPLSHPQGGEWLLPSLLLRATPAVLLPEDLLLISDTGLHREQQSSGALPRGPALRVDSTVSSALLHRGAQQLS